MLRLHKWVEFLVEVSLTTELMIELCTCIGKIQRLIDELEPRTSRKEGRSRLPREATLRYEWVDTTASQIRRESTPVFWVLEAQSTPEL